MFRLSFSSGLMAYFSISYIRDVSIFSNTGNEGNKEEEQHEE